MSQLLSIENIFRNSMWQP